jgi:Rps23 Pro-64 3,4-dihydroxylase Tpa1-like proline 4-hydroxylase
LDDLNKMPSNISDIFNLLYTDNFIDILKNLTNIKNLEYDPYLHGAGLHSHPKYGRLHVHLDYEKHPITGKERRLNLIYFTNKDWKQEYNGDLQIWAKNMSKCEQKIYPKFNSAVIFQTNDVSWHGLPDKILCPDDIPITKLV